MLFILGVFCCTDPRDELRFPTFNLFSMDAVQLAEQLTDIAGVCYVTVAVVYVTRRTKIDHVSANYTELYFR